MSSAFLFGDQSIAFFTRDFAVAHSLSLSAASHQLATLRKSGAVIQITRGVWANPNHPYFSPLSCIPKLLGGEHGYLSFLSALHLHGALSQIPATIQIATTGRARKLNSPIGLFEFLQLKPQLMQEGVVWSTSRVSYRIASIEKCLFDTCYLATRKGKRFASLPEIDTEAAMFSERRFSALTRHAPLSLSLRNAITKRAAKIFSKH